ncbi:MAG TPA: hypothetical protein VJ165_02635, partial [candidate division Zixibacteria bacterium]|nr:hypothetical protein [candidate division Zixibacteria bacterium]
FLWFSGLGWFLIRHKNLRFGYENNLNQKNLSVKQKRQPNLAAFLQPFGFLKLLSLSGIGRGCCGIRCRSLFCRRRLGLFLFDASSHKHQAEKAD